MQSIAGRWLDDLESFLEKLKGLPYLDLASRPLFLCQLIVFFRNTHYLPEQPWAIYRKITLLMLEEWDEKRGVRRSSRYAAFDPAAKLEFLSALAFHLTCRIKSTLFDREQLVNAYRAIHQLFELPPDEEVRVAQELETHTGIIVQSGAFHFEFSHLSLQEYLCAYYLVRLPFYPAVRSYVTEYPAPLAIAVTISADPNMWLIDVILRDEIVGQISPDIMESFFSRLEQEKPRLPVSTILGLSVLSVFFTHARSRDSLGRTILRIESIAHSVAKALELYKVAAENEVSDEYYLVKAVGREEQWERLPASHGFRPPQGGFLSRALFKAVTAGENRILSLRKVAPMASEPSNETLRGLG